MKEQTEAIQWWLPIWQENLRQLILVCHPQKAVTTKSLSLTGSRLNCSSHLTLYFKRFIWSSVGRVTKTYFNKYTMKVTENSQNGENLLQYAQAHEQSRLFHTKVLNSKPILHYLPLLTTIIWFVYGLLSQNISVFLISCVLLFHLPWLISLRLWQYGRV